MKQHLIIEMSSVELRLLVKDVVRGVLSETGLLKALGLRDDLHIVEEVASMLKLKRKTVYKLINEGKLQAIKKGKRHYVLRSQVLVYLESGQNQNSPDGSESDVVSPSKAQ